MFSIYRMLYPKPKYIWIQIHILYETKKAILVTAPYVFASEAKQSPQNDNIKIWIPKSKICGIRLKKSVFEVYVRENIVG